MTYPSPAFDINGNLVTVDLEGGDYSNLPEGYYTTPGQSAVARRVEENTGTPATAQEVGQLYSDTNPATQQAIQEIFDSPPPESDYVAPEPPAAQGWVAPAATPPPTSEQLIANMYRDNGLTPPPPAVLTQIATGQIDPPITAPLPTAATNSPPPAASVSAPTPPSAPNNSVDQRLPATTTPGIPPAPMIGIFDDTAAFVVGSSNGHNVMQLVDADGNLVQWIDGTSDFRYVTTAPAINEKRLIGADADGNPVFQMTDTAQNLVQWTENKTQTGYVVAPIYIRVGPDGKVTPPPVTGGGLPQSGGGNTAASGGGSTPPATTISLAKPTIQVGTTPAGLAVMQLVDAVGVVKQWIVNGNAIMDLVNAATYGVLFHTAATDAPVQNSGNGVPTGGGQPPAQSLEKPQIQVGTTSAGWPIYQIVDAAGVVKQWIIDPGPPSRIVDLVNVPNYGVLFHDSVTDAAVQNNGGGNVTSNVPSAGSSKMFLLGAALLAAAYLLNQ